MVLFQEFSKEALIVCVPPTPPFLVLSCATPDKRHQWFE